MGAETVCATDIEELLRSYEGKGLRCFPVGIDKRPFESWQSIPAETTDQRIARFRRYEDRPFLVGAVIGSYLVVDVDNQETWRQFVSGEAVEFTGPVVCTPSGGVHYWLRNGQNLPYTSFAWGELRTGDGHYVIVPGGATAEYTKNGHPIQGKYEWAPGTTPLTEWEGPLPDIPPELLLRVQTDGKPSAKPYAPCELIPEGQRNNRLLSMAGAMRRQGMNEEAILAALSVENNRCEPPLPEKELEGIAKSVCRYAPSELAGIERLTDAGNAEYIASLYGDKLRFDHKRPRWLVWGHHWWEPDQDGEVRRLALEAARKRQHLSVEIENTDARARVFNWGISSESRNKIDAALYLAQATKPLADNGQNWDIDRWLLGVANGVVDLRTGKLRPGRPDDRITKHTSVVYDPEAHPNRWLQFLFEIFRNDESMVDFVQRALGYSLTGDIREECLFLLHGSGQNGKGKFLETLRHVLGPYASNVAFSALEKLGRYSITNELADIAEARIVTASETNEGVRLNEGRLKAITGGDRITARFLHQNSFEYDPQYKLWLSFNHKPTIHDDSFGMWRRIVLIPFLQRFEVKEKMEPGDLEKDENLLDKLKAEKTAILTWGVQGCLRWQQNGLRPPDIVLAASAKYREESDPLADFISGCCILDPGKIVRAGALFKAYRTWAEEQKFDRWDILTSRAFGERIEAKFPRDRDGKGKFYRKIGLQDELL